MSTLRVTEIQSNSSSFNTPVRFETNGGVENGILCRTWVNFNGQGTIAIRADFNVNTISDGGSGQFVVNFSNNISDVNYAAVGNSGSTTQFDNATCTVDFSVPTVSNISMTVEDVDATDTDKAYNYVAIFR